MLYSDPLPVQKVAFAFGELTVFVPSQNLSRWNAAMLAAFKLSSRSFSTHCSSLFGFQTRSWTWYPLKYFFLYIQHTLVKIKSERELGGWLNWNWPHSLASTVLGSFYFRLNFIAKVFHNQNFMLAPPPLSIVRF